MVAATMFGSGLGGYLSHAISAAHAGSDSHSASHLGDTAKLALGDVAPAGSSGLQAPGCNGAIHIGSHCADAFCCSSAVPSSADRLNLRDFLRDRFVLSGSALPLGQLSFPLLRPPIAIV